MNTLISTNFILVQTQNPRNYESLSNDPVERRMLIGQLLSSNNQWMTLRLYLTFCLQNL